MDYSMAINSVADTIRKAGRPLTEAQKMLMAGAVSVWLEKVATDERVACCKAIDAIDDGEAPEYRACQEAIMERSN